LFPMIRTPEERPPRHVLDRYPEGLRGISARSRANKYARQSDYLTTYASAMRSSYRVEHRSGCGNSAICRCSGVDADLLIDVAICLAMAIPQPDALRCPRQRSRSSYPPFTPPGPAPQGSLLRTDLAPPLTLTTYIESSPCGELGLLKRQNGWPLVRPWRSPPTSETENRQGFGS